MRLTTAQSLPLAALTVLTVLVSACERPTAPSSPAASAPVLRIPNASISDGANAGRRGFYFLPAIVSNPGPFTGTFDATLEPYVTICRLVDETVGCGDGEIIISFPFGGPKPTGISVDALSESYTANWTKPTLGVGKYRLAVNVDATVFGLSRQIGLGFVDLQVIEKKKDPVDAGFVALVKGSPMPIKFRIETRTVGLILIGGFTSSAVEMPVGDRAGWRLSIVDLKGEQGGTGFCTGTTSTSSNPAVVRVVEGTLSFIEAVGSGMATVTITCGGVSATIVVTVYEEPVPD